MGELDTISFRKSQKPILSLVNFIILIVCVSSLLALTLSPDVTSSFLEWFLGKWEFLISGSDNKSNFYHRVISGKTNSNPAKCSKLLRQLGAEYDHHHAIPTSQFHYCERVAILLDSCLANSRSKSNFISQSELLAFDDDSSLRVQSANLLFIAFDPIGSRISRDSFTSKLLSFFVSALQKRRNSTSIFHTPTYTCQSSISAINLDNINSKIITYGPYSFPIHQVLSSNHPNLYIFWAKHPFVLAMETYSNLWRLLSSLETSSPSSSPPTLPQTVSPLLPLAGVSQILLHCVMTSNGSFQRFLESDRNCGASLPDNPQSRSMLIRTSPAPKREETLLFNSIQIKDLAIISGEAQSSGPTLKDKEDEEKREGKEQIRLHEQTTLSKVDYEEAVANIDKYVAYFGVEQSNSTQDTMRLFCRVLSLQTNCFGPLKSSTYPKSSSWADSVEKTLAKSSTFGNISGQLDQILAVLSEKSVSVLTDRNFWDLKLYEYVTRKTVYQLQNPLGNALP